MSSPVTVREWLQLLHLEELSPLFEQNHITLTLLPTLTNDDLRELGVSSIGHRKILLAAISGSNAVPEKSSVKSNEVVLQKEASFSPPTGPGRPEAPALKPQPLPEEAKTAVTAPDASLTTVPLPCPSSKKKRRGFSLTFLVVSIGLHVILGLGATYWVVQKIQAERKLQFKEGPPAISPNKRALEHKVSVQKKKNAGGAPLQPKRIAVAGLAANITLPDMPDLPSVSTSFTPGRMSGMGGAGFGGGMGIGSGIGTGVMGGKGLIPGGGGGMALNFFGVKAKGERILLLFDVSSSVVNKAVAAGIPLERIQEETIKLLRTLPGNAQFSLIQFTGNYMPFTGDLIAATPENKDLAQKWVEEKWVTSGTMASSASGVIQNLTGVVGVLERAGVMRPDVIFLISDASFQWRPEGTGGFNNIPYDEIKKAVNQLSEGLSEVPLHFIAFEPKPDDEKEWSRIVRKTGGEFRELKERDD